MIDSSSRNSVNSRDNNSPALSRCSWPTMRTGSALPTLQMELSLATKDLTFSSASLLSLRNLDLLEARVVVNENHEVEEAVLGSLKRSG